MNLLSLPVLIPLGAGSALLLLRGHRLRGAAAALSSLATLIAAVSIAWLAFTGDVLVMQMAAWPAPYGISLVADRLSALFLLLSSAVGLLTVLFSISSLRSRPRRTQSPLLNRAREAFGHHALMQFLFMGVHMSFLTGDLFNLFVAFEVMLIASYGLMLIGGELPQLREGFKYVVINLAVSAIFVASAGYAYGLFGTLNMADIGRVAALAPADDLRVVMVALLLALVFTTKAAIFPFGFWLPNSYPVPTTASSAFFAALLTKVGAYALLRTFGTMFPDLHTPQLLLLALAGATVIVGGLGAIARQRWRHTLAFANVASIGYLVLGTAIGTQSGTAAALFYGTHSVLVVFALFLIAALAEKIDGPSYAASGHLAVYPWLGVGFFVGALAMAGIPPTSGFVAKFGLVRALFDAGSWLHVAVAVLAVLGGFLLLYAMIQIWRGFFWGESDAVHTVPLAWPMRGITGVALVLLVALAAFAGPVYSLAESAAGQLRTDAYRRAVLVDNGLPDGFAERAAEVAKSKKPDAKGEGAE